MAQNYIQCGDVVNYTNGTGSAIASGDVVIIGSLVGVALVNIAIGATGSVQLEGVFSVAKTTPLAIGQGDKLYWNTGTSKVTKTATDTPIGVAFEDAASSDTTVLVSLYEQGHASPVAANVAAFSGTTNLPASSCAGGSTPTATNVNSAIDTVAAVAETRLDNIETKVNAIITALVNAGLMAAS